MKLRFWFLLPAWLWMTVLLVAPLAIVLAYSLLTRGVYGGVEKPWTLEGYQRLFDPLYLTILLRSFAMALAATALCLVFAFPAALFISRATKRKNLYLQLVMLPFWTSFLVRTYAWLFLLRDTGLINTVLQKLGIIHSRCRCSITTAPCCSAWSTAICPSWCCRFTPPSNGSIRRSSRPLPIWARGRWPRCSASSCRFRNPASWPARCWFSSPAWALT